MDVSIEYAKLVGRYDNIIVHYINKQEFKLALEAVIEIKNDDER